MRVTADASDPGKCEPLLRANDVYDAYKESISAITVALKSAAHTLSAIRHAKIGQSKLLHVVLESHALRTRVGLCNELLYCGEVLARDSAVSVLLIMFSHPRMLSNTYGTLWSTVARVQSGRRTGRFAVRLGADC
jgi:hypothetical protein